MTVSARIMAEILDHYHGPGTHKLWLLAWADTASEATRSGWCPRRVIARRIGLSERQADRIAAALIAEGVIKRQRHGHNGRPAMYVIGDLNGKRDGMSVPLRRPGSEPP